MTDDHKKQLWLWIVALLIGLPLLYIASFGPACWVSSRIGLRRSVGLIYQPVMQIWWHGQPPQEDDTLDRYTRFAATYGWGIGLEVESGAYDWGPRP